MIREIITPTEQELKLKLPPEYLNRKVEVLVFPVNDDPMPTQDADALRKVFEQVVGVLKGKLDKDPVAWQRQIRQEWDGREEKIEQLWTKVKPSS